MDGVRVVGKAVASARPARWLLAAVFVLAASAWAQPLLLVSEQEVAREMALPPEAIAPRAVPRPDAPTIRVLAPVLGGEPLGNPIRIELTFAAAPDAEIDPASFSALYGALRIDLTGRIVSRVTVEKTGLKVDNVVIPRGSHRILLRIADTKARTGETELRFSVQ
jgi:hypothetical protein